MLPKAFLEKHGTDFPAWDLEDSRRYTRLLARTHYENFLVASWLVPRSLRQDYCNVYAYCRWADDLADEMGDPHLSLRLLAWWREQLLAMDRGSAFHPVFVALRDTVSRHALPRSDFEDLLTAFVRDQQVRSYSSYADLLDYCRYSANPVGRLVLRLNGCQDDLLFEMSDSICTALQLANHWQDIGRDLGAGRVYVPEDVMQLHGCSTATLEHDMRSGTGSSVLRATVSDLVGRTRDLFLAGLPLAGRVRGRLSLEIELFAKAGLRLLDRIDGLGGDTIAVRPTITGRDRAGLVCEVVTNRCLRRLLPGREPAYADP